MVRGGVNVQAWTLAGRIATKSGQRGVVDEMSGGRRRARWPCTGKERGRKTREMIVRVRRVLMAALLFLSTSFYCPISFFCQTGEAGPSPRTGDFPLLPPLARQAREGVQPEGKKEAGTTRCRRDCWRRARFFQTLRGARRTRAKL